MLQVFRPKKLKLIACLPIFLTSTIISNRDEQLGTLQEVLGGAK